MLKSRNRKLRLLPKGFAITVINEDRAAAGSVGAVDVAPAIPDEEAFGEIDSVRRGRTLQHAGRRFSAIARIAMSCAAVKTNFNPIERGKEGPEILVHGFNDLPGLSAAAHIGLVGHHDEEETGFLQFFATLNDAGIELEILNPSRRIRKSVADHRPVEHSVPIQKDRALCYFVLSHFVCAALSAGWETKRCQTTA